MNRAENGHGMASDLSRLRALIGRRRALQWFAGAGTAALMSGCGESGSGASEVGAVSGASTATPTSTPTPSPTPTPTPTSAVSACIVEPTETAGPYPADGTNTAAGATSNVLTMSGVVRSDIRTSFISSTVDAGGVALSLTLTLVNVNAACAPLSGFAIYLWCCDRQGHYSLYTAAAESYLRGVQVTDANGQVTFRLYFPACYDGRWPHIHFEIYSNLSSALGSKYAILTSQLALPAAICSAVYADTATYPSSASNFARISLSSDIVFADNSSAQLAQQTPSFSGSVAAGYTATALIGVAR